MKSYIVAAFLACVVVAVSAKSCTEQEDCKEKECCVGFMPFRGKCKSLSKKGNRCLTDEPLFPFNDIHIVACPCAEGLECVKKGKGKTNSGVCLPESATTVAPTTEGSSESSESSSSSSSSEESGEKSTPAPVVVTTEEEPEEEVSQQPEEEVSHEPEPEVSEQPEPEVTEQPEEEVPQEPEAQA